MSEGFICQLMNIRSDGTTESEKQKDYNTVTFYYKFSKPLCSPCAVVVRPCKRPTRRFSERRKVLWRQNTRLWREQLPLNMTETKWNGSLRCETSSDLWFALSLIQEGYNFIISCYLCFCLSYINCLHSNQGSLSEKQDIFRYIFIPQRIFLYPSDKLLSILV